MSLKNSVSFVVMAAVLVSASAAVAQEAQDTVSTLVVTAPKESAVAVAPSAQPMEVAQPTSLVTADFIVKNLQPTVNYESVVEITPSVSAVAPNGPGLMEAQYVSIRGFQDGQFNLTVDGLAWGDSNDFTHHTTSYLMAHDIGVVAVNRGPGTASTLGDATFGGSISIITKDPLQTMTEEVYGSAASFGSYLGGAEFDTGAIASLNGARGLIDISHLQSNGFLTYSGLNRTNVFGKFILPINDRTIVTAMAMYNTLHQNVSLGSTLAQQAAYGYNYALNNDPASQDYFGYNYDQIATDMAYIGVTSDLGNGFNIDNKAYTYGYWHRGYNGDDPNGTSPGVVCTVALSAGGCVPNITSSAVGDVPGQKLVNDYYSLGDVLRLIKSFGDAGEIKTGFWYDHQFNHRRLFEQDFTLGGIPDPLYGAAAAAGVPGPAGAIDRYQTNLLDTFQPYVEADWTPLPGLTVTPGVKWNYFKRTIHALYNQKTGTPLDFQKSWSKVLPSLEVRYQPSNHWSFYAQAAQGFLAPNLNVFYVPSPGLSTTLKPQTTWNYQAGGTYRLDRVTVSADVYYIDFNNEILKKTVQGQAIFYNAGGVIYKGVEGEATIKLVDGLSLYANGSINSAKDKASGATIPMTPKSTAAGGLIYEHDRLYGSLLAKYTGPQYGDFPGNCNGSSASGPRGDCPIAGFTVADLSLSYTLPRDDNRPAIRITGLIDNLFDKHGTMALAGYSGEGDPFFWNIVPRNYSIEISLAF